MKKNICYLIIFILGISSLILYFCGIILFNDNKVKYKYFKNELLVGVDGDINLEGVKDKRDSLYLEIINLFNDSDYNYDKYLSIIDNKKNDNDLIKKDKDNLSNKVSELDSKKKNLSNEYNVLYKKYNSLNSNKVISVSTNNKYNFPLINQYPKYQTGCESVSLTMLLKYHGVNVTPDMVIARLKKGSLPYYENGKTYGGNPELEFVGNPYSKSSFGTYERPIAEVANSFKSGIQIKNKFYFNEVIKLVRGGTPVMVWTSMGLSLPYISTSWIYKPTMEVIKWKANEHAVVMIDATDSSVVIADPMGGKLKTYSRSLFEQRYNYFGKKALYYLWLIILELVILIKRI